MKVLVDTAVWSLALRRGAPRTGDSVVGQLIDLVQAFRATIIGPIRQELLSGIKERAQYELLRERLRAFPDLPLRTQDYELAAEFFDSCRAKGVQGSNTDFLICAVAARRRLSIFTTDQDFENYSRVLGVALHGA